MVKKQDGTCWNMKHGENMMEDGENILENGEKNQNMVEHGHGEW